MTTQQLYQIYLQHPIVTTDSRNCPDGSLFFALKGDAFDGNKFAQAALDKGCSFAIVDNADFVTHEKFILVDDVLKALSDLANFHRVQLNKPVIAITGTNGKTTTKELVLTALSAKYKVCATSGNFNNHIGLPLTLLKATSEDDIIITEMGANHMGEIAYLCNIANPDFGIITNIGKAHLEGFGSYENIITTKTELYRHIKSVDGKLFINNLDDLLVKHAEGIETIPYGETDNFQLSISETTPFLTLKYVDKNGEQLVQTKFIGSYNLINFKAAIAVGKYFKVEIRTLLAALEAYQPANNRSQFNDTGKNKIIQDAYNANPSSVVLAIQNFEEIENDSKCYILGEMKELGEYEATEHQHIVDLLQNTNAQVFLIGDAFYSTKKPNHFQCFKNTKDAKEYLTKHPLSNKTILLKGSRSMQLESLLDIL